MSKHIGTALTRMRRSPYQSFAAVSIMTMTLFLASVFTLLAAGSQAVLRHFETRPQINAFFKQAYVPNPQEVERITAQLEATGKVETVKYVSKEDAYRIYKDLNSTDPLLLEAVTSSMLPASIEVSAKDPKFMGELASSLKQEANIDDVRFAEEIVGVLTMWTNAVRVIGLSLVGSNVLITFLIIILIIGIKVANRREEITTLQLLGASRGYISSPFIYEGVLYGLIGAFLAWGTTYLIVLYSTSFWKSFLGEIPLLPQPILLNLLYVMLQLLGAMMLLGSVVGGLGGIIAARRFLKA